MGKNITGRRQYESIRSLLSHIYLYGFFSREDFEAANIIKVKSYDQELRLIYDIFPKDEQNALVRSGRKYPRMERLYTESGKYGLSGSYSLYTMDEQKELPLTLSMLNGLAQEPATAPELCSRLEKEGKSDADGSSLYNWVLRHLKDLASAGYLCKNGSRFAVSPDILGILSEDELMQFEHFVTFASGVGYPRATGYFICEQVANERYRRGDTHEHPSPFLLRHNTNANILDEDLVYQLLDIIAQHAEAEVKWDKLKTEKAVQGRVKPAAETVTLLPVAVRIDTRLGRWYLLGMRGEMPTMVRLGSIHAVKKGKPVSEEVWEHAVQTVADTFTHTGCSGRITYGDTTEVRAELHFDSAPGMRTQFEREIRQGQIIEQDGQEYYCAYVNDPGELVPFLRSFAPWLRILPGEHDLDSRISSQLTQMLENLEKNMP